MDFDGRGGNVFENITNDLADRGKNLYDQAVASGEAPEGSQQAFLQRFAVVLDNKLTTFPTIDFRDNPDGIKGGNAQITGLDSAQRGQGHRARAAVGLAAGGVHAALDEPRLGDARQGVARPGPASRASRACSS